MGAADHQHAQAALADAAADGERKLIVKQHAVEGQLRALLTAGELQLARQRFRIHANAHAGNLERAAEHIVPEENVAVERPVVVIGRAAVVRFAGAQLAADLHDQRGLMLLQIFIFALTAFWNVRIHVLQLLRGNGAHLAAEAGMNAGILAVQAHADIADAVHDLLRGAFERIERAILSADHLLPVPLIHIHGMQIVQRLIAADGVHVRIDALAHAEVVFLQGIALPLRQRVHHLAPLAHGGHIERHGALIAVQAGIRLDEQRRGHAAQIQRIGQLLLKIVLDKFDGHLHVVYAQRRAIALRNKNTVHVRFLPDGKVCFIIAPRRAFFKYVSHIFCMASRIFFAWRKRVPCIFSIFRRKTGADMQIILYFIHYFLHLDDLQARAWRAILGA